MKRLPIEKAEAVDVEGITWLRVTAAGQTWAFCPVKASLLQCGIMLLPPDLSEYGETLTLWGPDPAPGKEQDSSPIENASADPVLVELARRLWVHELHPGEPVKIPTLEEAQAARWTIDPYAGIFRRII